MSSSYSTFSQAAHAHVLRKEEGNGGDDSADADADDTPYSNGAADTPAYLPPPPETPGSMASTPNFESLPRPSAAVAALQLQQQQLLSDNMLGYGSGGGGMSSAKKPRVEY